VSAESFLVYYFENDKTLHKMLSNRPPQYESKYAAFGKEMAKTAAQSDSFEVGGTSYFPNFGILFLP
jgi:hypothetical protein